MGTILPESSTFDPQIVSPNPGEPVRASDSAGIAYVIAGIDFNGGVIYVGINPSARVRHLGGLSQTLAVTVVGTDITVQLGTDAMGNVTSLANQVVTAFMGNAAAVALATASAQGTGNSLAGINATFLALSQDVIGSIRPPLQHITNRTRYLHGIDQGLISVKNIYADGVGGGANGSVGADIGSTAAVRAGTQMVAQTNISSINGLIQTLHPVNGDIHAAHDLNSDNDLNVGNNAYVNNLTQTNYAQIQRARGGTTLPNLTIPIGELNQGNMISGSARVAPAVTPTVTFLGGLNVNTITHPSVGLYRFTFFNNLSSWINIHLSRQTGSPAPFKLDYNIISLSPVIIDVDTNGVDSIGFSLGFNGE